MNRVVLALWKELFVYTNTCSTCRDSKVGRTNSSRTPKPYNQPSPALASSRKGPTMIVFAEFVVWRCMSATLWTWDSSRAPKILGSKPPQLSIDTCVMSQEPLHQNCCC
jgi:hypothetical protein